jgi:hypothetical protein
LKDSFRRRGAVPGAEQGCDFLRGNARGILRQEALLRDDIEAREQAEAIVGNERHDVALALDRPELKGEGGQQGLQSRDHTGARQLGAFGQCLRIETNEVGDGHEQAANARPKLARGKRKFARIGDSTHLDMPEAPKCFQRRTALGAGSLDNPFNHRRVYGLVVPYCAETVNVKTVRGP